MKSNTRAEALCVRTRLINAIIVCHNNVPFMAMPLNGATPLFICRSTIFVSIGRP